jgi:hypothetical protein
VFATTRWSVVLAAQGGSETARAALETLCGTYWFPVYAVVRRQGFDPDTARDFTQEFFVRLLARDGVARCQRASSKPPAAGEDTRAPEGGRGPFPETVSCALRFSLKSVAFV